MIVEFFGLPGSGKTTIMNQFIDHREDDVVVRGTLDHLSGNKRIFLKLLHSFLCVFVNPIFWGKNVFFFVLKRRRSVNDFVNITYLYARYFRFKGTKKIVVFDQGLLQAYWSILSFNSIGEDYNNDLIEKKIRNVIIIELEKSINKRRLKERNDNSSRLQRGTETELWKVCLKNFNRLRNELEANQLKGILNSGLPVQQNIEKLEAIVNRK